MPTDSQRFEIHVVCIQIKHLVNSVRKSRTIHCWNSQVSWHIVALHVLSWAGNETEEETSSLAMKKFPAGRSVRTCEPPESLSVTSSLCLTMSFGAHDNFWCWRFYASYFWNLWYCQWKRINALKRPQILSSKIFRFQTRCLLSLFRQEKFSSLMHVKNARTIKS